MWLGAKRRYPPRVRRESSTSTAQTRALTGAVFFQRASIARTADAACGLPFAVECSSAYSAIAPQNQHKILRNKMFKILNNLGINTTILRRTGPCG
jgi:hypothetical protein